jgi:hypothetical protein
MVFAVDISKDRTVQLVADEVEIVENGYGGQIVKFYTISDDLKARDKNGHIYADFGARTLVASYYLDKIRGFRQVEGILDSEYAFMNRAGIFESMGMVDPLMEDEDGGECEEVTE